MGDIVNMQEAAVRLEIAPSTMRVYISRNRADFPVLKKGQGRDEYELDFDDVEKWAVKHKLGKFSKRKKGLGSEDESEKESERKKRIEADILQLKLDQMNLKLVNRDDMVNFFSAKMAMMAKQFDLMPNIIGRELNLSPDIVEKLREKVNEFRLAFVRGDEGFFSRAQEMDGSGKDFQEEEPISVSGLIKLPVNATV